MKTTLITLTHEGERQERDLDMDEDPSLAEIREAVAPSLAGGRPEHVTVLYEGRRADMFVDEDGFEKDLPRNEAATTLYRASWMERHPGTDPEDLPWIAGTAVLFDRIVWR